MSKFTVTKLDHTESATPAPPPKGHDESYKDVLSPEQQVAYEKFVAGENIFVTGPGGTGKTKLVQYLVDYANSINKSGQVCAMTGCAAVLIGCKARTIHSWSGIKLAKGPKDKIITAAMKNRNAVKEWKTAKYLILDEVSMLSQKIFEILEELGRRIRKNPAIFGGLQVVFLGDFFQLPPIETENDPGTEKFCFESPLWRMVFGRQNHIQLTKIFRQNDPLYIDILMQIRQGHLDEEKTAVLETYVNRTYDPEKNNGCVPAKLFALRAKVDMINKQMFTKIDEKEYVNEALVKTDCTTHLESGKALSLDVLQKCRAMTLEQKDYEVENLLNTMSATRLFRFKKGASVMCCVNLDMDNQICNGAQGIITDIIEDGLYPAVVVKFSNGIVKRIIPHFWQSEEYPTIAVGQYPLILAWALTIHKIQGATMKLAEIDIGSSIFEYGQTYVALSRIQSLDGLYLSAFHPQKIRANPLVVEFYKGIA